MKEIGKFEVNYWFCMFFILIVSGSGGKHSLPWKLNGQSLKIPMAFLSRSIKNDVDSL